MTAWHDFLAANDAHLVDGIAESFGESRNDYPTINSAICDLADQGILAVAGPDAQKFLQGQSTPDFDKLSPGSVTPGAICNPKGRMLTSFYASMKTNDEVLLSMHRALVASTSAALEKYAVFFKTTLTDASDVWHQFGVFGPEATAALRPAFQEIPAPNQAVADTEGNMLLALGPELFIVLAQADRAPEMWAKLTQSLQPAGLPLWSRQMIMSGLALVTPTLTEQFIPQMFNLQAIGGVSFKKGCYTGQEVVARMQYLGQLKRRTYIVRIRSERIPPPGSPIENIDDGKSLGTVILAAPIDARDVIMLVVLREAALEEDRLAFDGQALAFAVQDLPYEISDQ